MAGAYEIVSIILNLIYYYIFTTLNYPETQYLLLL